MSSFCSWVLREPTRWDNGVWNGAYNEKHGAVIRSSGCWRVKMAGGGVPSDVG